MSNPIFCKVQLRTQPRQTNEFCHRNEMKKYHFKTKPTESVELKLKMQQETAPKNS